MTMLGEPLGARLASGHHGSDSAREGPILPWKPCVSVSHNSAMWSPSPRYSSGFAGRLPSRRAPSQYQATNAPQQNKAALHRNATRRLKAASTPPSMGLTAEPISAPLFKTPKALARFSTGITDPPRPYDNVRMLPSKR